MLARTSRSPNATGGNFIVEANEYRHHIFTSSGTFSINNVTTLTVMVQDGGQTGTNAFAYTYTRVPGGPIQKAVSAGSGGNSGQVRYLSGSSSSQITVVVGAAGGASSISESLSQISTFTATGGAGATAAFFDVSDGVNGENGRLHTAVTNIWNNVPNIEARSGGGGGGGSAAGPSGVRSPMPAGSQGTSFRGAGGQGQDVVADGNWDIQSTSGPYSGNAGYVVISYPLL
jgi:hypothetical protein